MSLPSLKAGKRMIRPGDHACLLYTNEQEHELFFKEFLLDGLEQDEQIIYIGQQSTPEKVLSYFQYTSLKIKNYLEKGQLVFLTAEETYLQYETYCIERVIDLLDLLAVSSQEAAYSSLSLTSNMSWALDVAPGACNLIEHEYALTEFIQENHNCSVLCQYDRRIFAPEILLQTALVHPIIIVGSKVFRNPYYLSPEQMVGHKTAADALEYWLSNMLESFEVDIWTPQEPMARAQDAAQLN
jgi:two-component system, sensor histidine kinase PdtaS